MTYDIILMYPTCGHGHFVFRTFLTLKRNVSIKEPRFVTDIIYAVFDVEITHTHTERHKIYKSKLNKGPSSNG